MSFIRRTIFQIGEEDINEITPEQRKIKSFKQISVRKQLKSILTNKQNLYLKESLANLKNRNSLEGFSEETPTGVQQCYFFFSSALANARNLKSLDLSGMDMHPLLAIEIGQGIQRNSSLLELNLASCKMNSFCLQYIFSSISNHRTLQSLNLYNNQGFTMDLMNDFSQFIFKGKNRLKKIKFTHCNITSSALSYLLRNLKYSETITQVDLSMMNFNHEVLTSLVIALQHYKGNLLLEYLNLGDNTIRDDGMETLARNFKWSIRNTNIRELNLRRNFITQNGVEDLETFLRNISQLQKLDLSSNKIQEFKCQNLLQRKLYEINLSNNIISQFPQQFFMQTLVINLQNNNISSQGAFQLSSLLRQNPMWIELNLSNNQLKSEGFNSLIFGLRDNRMLKKLIVANNQLDGEAIICYMINHEQVYFEHLDLSFNRIRHEMIFVLLNFIKSGVLRCLRCACLQLDEQPSKVDNCSFLPKAQGQQMSKATFQLTSYNLRELDFHLNKQIFTPVMASLANYFNKIEKLDLSTCSPIGVQDIELLCQFLRKSTTIHELNLRDLRIGQMKKEVVKKLSEACYNSTLKYLNLSKNRLYLQFRKLFNFSNSEQRQNYKLEILDLSQNLLESKHSQHLQTIITQFRSLQDLNLSRNSFNFYTLHSINVALHKIKTLKRINLSNCKLCADEMLIVSQMLGNENLQEINISNNPYTTQLKTFYHQCSTQQMQFLELQQMYFDQPNFYGLMKIIKTQKQSLKGIQLDACIFQNGHLESFFELLTKCKRIEYFALIYNPTIDKELRGLIDKFQYFKQLKVFKINQTSLTWTYMQALAEWVQNEQYCQLITLDLSRNKLSQQILDCVCLGVSRNQTIQNFILSECSLGQMDLTLLGAVIANNPVLEILDLSKNNIVDNLGPLIMTALSKQGSSGAIREIILANNPLSKECILQLFIPKQQDIISYQSLKLTQIDFTNCQLKYSLISDILDAQLIYESKFSFQLILNLNLSNNQLDDNAACVLRQLLEKNNSIQHLNLSMNNFTSEGGLHIFMGLLLNQTVRIVDFSNNQLGNNLTIRLTEILSQEQLKSLQFILLRNNSFTKEGYQQLTRILQLQKSLFIDNVWQHIEDDQGKIILSQYIRIGTQYNLNQTQIPNYLKEIIIQKSFLSDQFCEQLADLYPLLGFIELIDISDNSNITMYGKVYLFIHLFDQSYIQHKLKAMYVTDSQETRKLFDDGLLKYLILRFRNYAYPQIDNFEGTISKVLYSVPNNQQQTCGFWSKMLLHQINKMVAYLDSIEPPQFIVSTLFIGKFRRNNINIKIISFIFLLFAYLVNSLQFNRQGTLTSLEDKKQYFDKHCSVEISNCENIGADDQRQDLLFFYIVLVLSTLIGVIELYVAIKLRQKIQPAFQIVHPSLLKLLHARLPHLSELYLMMKSIISKIATYQEKIIFLYSFRLSEMPSHLSEGTSISFDTLRIVLLVYITAKWVDEILIQTFSTFRYLCFNPKNHQAKYLTLFQLAVFHQRHHIIYEMLRSICPQQGYCINNKKHIKMNEVCLIELFRLILFEIPGYIIFSLLYYEYFNLVRHHFQSVDPYGSLLLLINIAIIKCLVGIIWSLHNIFTIRPAVVKQHGFNQALTIKQFYENRMQFVDSSKLKIQCDSSSIMLNDSRKKQLIQLSKYEINSRSQRVISHRILNKMADIQEEENGDDENEGNVNIKQDEQLLLKSIDDEDSEENQQSKKHYIVVYSDQQIPPSNYGGAFRGIPISVVRRGQSLNI